MTSDDSQWLPPTQDSGSGQQPSAEDLPGYDPYAEQAPSQAPRYGAYGTAPAGQPVPPVTPTAPQVASQGRSGVQAGTDGTSGYPSSYGAAQDYPGAVPGYPDTQSYPGAAPGGYPVGAAPGFLLAPKPGIVPLRPLGVSEIIGGAFEALRANPRAMFIPSLLVMSVIGLISAVISFFSSSSLLSTATDLESSESLTHDQVTDLMAGAVGSLSGSLLQGVLLSLATTILTGLLIMTVSRSVLGRIATPGEVWSRTKGRIWALIGQSLLVGLITGGIGLLILGAGLLVMGLLITSMSSGTEPSAGWIITIVLTFLALGLATLICSVFLGVRLSVSSAALVLENVGVIEGIKRSWRLTRGSFWRVLGVLALSALIAGAAGGVLGGAVGMITSTGMLVSPDALTILSAVSSFLTALVQALVIPFSAAVVALTYIDLRMRNEGLDVELRQAAGF